ncbi:MAG: hypothetical protein WBN10_06865 [Polyangiales bacterium]
MKRARFHHAIQQSTRRASTRSSDSTHLPKPKRRIRARPPAPAPHLLPPQHPPGQGRPVDVIEGHGIYGGPYDFDFDFAIVLDTNNGLIFSFVWNLQD